MEARSRAIGGRTDGWIVLPVAPGIDVTGAADASTVVAGIGIGLLAVIGAILIAQNRLDRRRERGPVDRDEPESEIVTDRERVHALIEENGGRMRQTEIVESVEWSKAKVSRLLADLESDDEITKLRLGRENLICLPGNEPPASRSSEQGRSE
ncbi:helix-turn-helix domain-containing protein [Halovivax sp.]|uniref:helix-turn-helix transcriptional regulator n=1 Tax=Halovivax sp. TaxID=1935978 RepID=UPI0025BE4478|nr:helix-turn-helix domain-containing protein [Halovivax sp.]